MKGITTIAALPSGAGQAANLPAEVGKAKPKPVDLWQGVADLTVYEDSRLAYESMRWPAALGFAVSPCIGKAVDPLTGEEVSAGRKTIEYGKTACGVVNVVGAVDAKTRAQIAADLKKSDVAKWKRHYRGEPVQSTMPPEHKED